MGFFAAAIFMRMLLSASGGRERPVSEHIVPWTPALSGREPIEMSGNETVSHAEQ